MRRWSSLLAVVTFAACSRANPEERATPPAAPPPGVTQVGADAAPVAPSRTLAVAQGDGSVVLMQVIGDRLESGPTLTEVGWNFGWLDRRTLVALGPSTDADASVRRWVDGVRQPDLVVRREAWPAYGRALWLVGANEIWLAGCRDESDVAPCARPTYARLWPAPVEVGERAPGPDARPIDSSVPYPLPPEGPAPAGATVTLRPDPKDHARTTVRCEAGGSRTEETVLAIFDNPREEGAWSFAAPAVRWIATSTPRYEVSFDATNPVGGRYRIYHYAAPCEESGLRALAWLGDELWAEQSSAVDATWTVYRSGRALGTFAGTMVR
ncbi:MAG: hypothetical protein KBG48_04535 [Kofleriaceae bacterium]|nr:hypothetical protein [Kofleriaceae bacterium]MBP9166627.1 hypothetical protein [Kofleriaceae bacterium]MBP9858453.1 hypothetical protein [Kofleriaceae bacterium]